MRELIAVVRAVAPTQITVLLMGESGTGKEVFARLIHDWSSRSGGPFITVNCGAIPEGLIESELFGHEKGSFTGATGERKGFFEAAKGGTIFLDEIGEMPLAAQVKLLRVLETGKFTRVGSTTERTTDARVVAATNRDLEQEVRAGRFRTDLYYRLRAVMLRLPPLRNRRDDIPALVDTILNDLIKRHSLPHKPHLEPAALELLTMNEWRGNVRELRNTLEQLAVLSFSPGVGMTGTITEENVQSVLLQSSSFQWNQPLSGEHYPIVQSVRDIQPSSELALIYRALLELRADISEIKDRLFMNGTSSKALPPIEATIGDDLNVERTEQRLITAALERFGGDRSKAATALGISERTLYRKLKEIQ
jgi:DNA-binding NtrC family response regulator